MICNFVLPLFILSLISSCMGKNIMDSDSTNQIKFWSESFTDGDTIPAKIYLSRE